MLKLRDYLPLLTVRTAARILKDYTGMVADIACGNGALFKEIRNGGNKNIFGIDISWNQIIGARAKGASVVMGNILEMPFKNRIFDTAVCLNTIYNFASLPEFEPAFKEMIRVVKDNGRILIDIRNKKNPILRFKYWWHNRKKLFPTIPYYTEDIEIAMKAVGCRLLQKSAVGIDNPYLAWGYIMVFEKEKDDCTDLKADYTDDGKLADGFNLCNRFSKSV